MKKVYSYLSLLLLLFVGVSEASAQRYVRDGEPLSTIPVGQSIVLQAGTSNDGITTTSSTNNAAVDRDIVDVLSGTTKKNSISPEAIYQFEDAGTTSDGLQTYYLKQVSTGKYLAAASISYTTSKLQAFRFTAELARLDSVSFRSYTKESTAVNAFVLTSAKSTGSNPIYLECLYYSQGVSFAKWQDCNVWQVYNYREANGTETLQAVLAELFPNGYDAAAYPIGNGPGQYTQATIDALTAAYDAAVAASTSSTATDAEKRQAAIDLDAAYNAAVASVKNFAAGAYYMLNWRSGTTNNQVADGGPYDAAYARNDLAYFSTNFTLPTDVASTDVTYIWEFIEDGEGGYFIRNFATGKYMYSPSGQIGKYSLVDESQRQAFTVNVSTTATGYFTIVNKTPGNASYPAMHTEAATLRVVNWTTDALASNWRFSEAGDLTALQYKIDSINAANAQAALNDSLSTLYDNSVALVAKDKVYTSAATKDGVFTVGDGLVVDASQLGSNAAEPSEGSLAGLLDAQLSTYFHTVWSATSPAAPHNLIVDLGTAVNAVVLKYGERDNAGGGDPKGITVYASNDTTGNNWTEVTKTTFTYDYMFTGSDGVASTTRRAGMVAVDLGSAYRYIRLDVNTTYSGGTTADANGVGRYWWYLSEFRAYEATYDAANSTYEAIKNQNAAVVSEFEAAMAAAKTDLADGTATSEVYERLKAAYNAYKALSPDVTNVTTPLAAFKTFVTPANAGTDAGCYPQEAIDAANAVISEVEATIASTSVYTVAQVADLVAKVKNARAAFDAALVMINGDGTTYYQIKSVTSGAAANNYLYAANSATGDAYSQATIKWGGYDATTGGVDDKLQAGDRLNYIWKATQVGEGKYVFQNLYTGNYLRSNPTNNVVERMSATPDTITLRSARLSGTPAFNLLTVEDGSVMLNAQPSSGNLVTWGTGQGADNSAFVFEETIPTGTMYLSIAPAQTIVVTLPYEVDSDFSEGKAYSVTGKKDGKVQLQEISGSIAGGTPFVFIPNNPADSVAEIAVYATGEVTALDYATAASNSNGLYGTLQVDTASTQAGYLLKADADDQWYVTQYSAATAVAPNSGYFIVGELPDVTTDGDATILIDPEFIVEVGIGTATTGSTATGAVYTLSGVKVRSNGTTKGLPAGIYIVNGQKVYVK